MALLIKGSALMLIRVYRWLVSPAIHLLAGPGYGCRFTPTCSSYALEAIQVHGVTRGSTLALGRIMRCRPGVTGGWDPPPPSKL